MAPARRSALSALSSPAFVSAVGVLLTNDLLWKWLFPGLVTGKLSDFAGLFAFPFFVSAFAPRHRLGIYVVTALGFVVWKLPVSGPMIATWNRAAPFAVDRVADPWDLIALIVLPLSFWGFGQAVERRAWKPLRPLAVAVIAVFAFAATSYRTQVPMDDRFVFAGSSDELENRLVSAGIQVTRDGQRYSSAVPENGWLIWIPSDVCFDRVDAYIEVQPLDASTEVHLRGMAHRCPKGRDDKARLRAEFVKKVVTPLSLEPADPAAASPP